MTASAPRSRHRWTARRRWRRSPPRPRRGATPRTASSFSARSARVADPALDPLVAHAARAAVLVDFDGSLAPIVDDPDAAIPLPAARDALAALVGRVALVAVVSGRPLGFLRDALGIDGVTYVGQYGVQRWVDGRVVTDARVEPYLGLVEATAFAAARELPGVLVERKDGVAVVLHWRQ